MIMNEEMQQVIALLIDCENIASSFYDALLKELSTLG